MDKPKRTLTTFRLTDAELKDLDFIAESICLHGDKPSRSAAHRYAVFVCKAYLLLKRPGQTIIGKEQTALPAKSLPESSRTAH